MAVQLNEYCWKKDIEKMTAVENYWTLGFKIDGGEAAGTYNTTGRKSRENQANGLHF